MLTVYSMGDQSIIQSVLNASAMVFNSSMFDPTQGAGVVLIGLLMGILYMIMPVMGGAKLNPLPIIFVIVLFWAGVLPRETLQIEDIYTGSIVTVANIPEVVALPASLAASLSHAITTNVETAFQTTSGSYLSMGAQGFVNPLKLLLSLRDPHQTEKVFPYLSESLTEFVKYCAPTDPNFTFAALTGNPNMVTYLTGLNVTGIMTYWSSANPNGYGTSCSQGQTNLTNDTSPGVINAIANNVLATNTAGSYPPGSTSQPNVAGLTQAYNSVTAGLMGNMQSAQGFMLNAIAMMPVKQGVDCVNQPTGPNMSDCMGNVIVREALEKQNVDAAAQASVFTQTMIPAMNILLALFYAFAPIMIAVAFMSGAHGIKIIFSLFIFGAWTQTWMPIAAVINYMIQLQVQYAFSALPPAGVTMENYMQFYSVLTMKIGIASTLLSMIPMISMALLSGSVMALTSVAQGMSAKDYSDESKVAPSVGSNSATVENGAMIGQPTRMQLQSTTGASSGWDMGTNQAYNPFSKVNLSETQRKSYEDAHTNSNTAQRSVDQTLANTLTSDMSSQKVTEWAQGVQHATAATDSHAATSAKKWVSDLAKTEDLTKEDQELLTVGVGAKLLGNEATTKKAFGMMKKQGVAQKITDSEDFKTEQSRVHKEESNRSFAKNLKTNAASILKNDSTNQVAEAVTSSEKADDTLKRAEARTSEVGLSNQQDMQVLGAQSAAIPGSKYFIDGAVEEKDKKHYQDEEQRILSRVANSGAPMTVAARNAAKLQALHSVSPDKFMEVLQGAGLAGLHSSQAPQGKDVVDLNKNVQGKAKDIDQNRFAKVEQKTAPAANLKGSGGAHKGLIDGTIQVANAQIEESIHDQDHLGAGGTMGKARVQAEQAASTRFLREVDQRGWVNEHGDIAGMANIAEAGRQLGNFEQDHPVAAAAISMTPVGRLMRAGAATAKLVEELGAAKTALSAAKTAGNAQKIGKAEKNLERVQAAHQKSNDALTLYKAKYAAALQTAALPIVTGQGGDAK